ncbi:MAG: single-stranded DNA-binding protein [Erysipelotrichia bacterium]|nr:single-stranded DNA-binding protein [Erysipelotrichia bacterium]
MNLNSVILIGRLTKDIDIRMTNSNKKYAQLTLAVNRDKEKADFIPVIAWEKTAELLSTYCHKGSKINVVGRLQTRDYTDNTGRKVYVVEVVANQIEFLDSKNNASATPQNEDTSFSTNNYIDSDELPF